MMSAQLYISAQKAGYLLCVFLSILSATTLLTIVSGQGTSNQLCSSQMCISATIYSKQPDTIEFSLSSKIAVGWLGLGMGGISNGMKGNDLALCWPNATGNGALISQRSNPTTNGNPTPLASVAFTVQQAKSGLSKTSFICTFSRPLNLSVAPLASTAPSVNVIYAVGLQAVKAAANGNPQQAVIQQHTYTGHGTLIIQRKAGSSSDPNNTISISPGAGASNGTGSGDSGLDSVLAQEMLYARLVKVHASLMSIAFLLLFPTGAIIVRFFSHLDHVFKFHRPIQVTGFLFVISGIGCILGAVYNTPDGPPEITETSHSLLGLIIFIALILQICYGIYIYHAYNPSVDVQKTVHRVLTWIHRGWGYSVLITGLVQIKLGMVLYGMWPNGNEGIWYAYYVWVALLALVFVVGSIVKFIKPGSSKFQDDHYKSNPSQSELQYNPSDQSRSHSRNTSNGTLGGEGQVRY